MRLLIVALALSSVGCGIWSFPEEFEEEEKQAAKEREELKRQIEVLQMEPENQENAAKVAQLQQSLAATTLRMVDIVRRGEEAMMANREKASSVAEAVGGAANWLLPGVGGLISSIFGISLLFGRKKKNATA